MNRETKILQHIKKDGYGIEIGPSHSPIAPKKNGYKVHIIDHMNREELIAKYKDHGVDYKNIEEVDFVWQGEKYSKLTDKSKYYDWIIASHVIEHTPDLIGFLNDCDDILKDDGVISLAIPDKRFCFDNKRPITGISKIIDSHFQKDNIHSPGTVAEYFLNVVSKNGKVGWDKNSVGEYKFIHSAEDALNGMNAVVNNGRYLDVHAWCFVPHSFRLIIHDLHSLGIIPFKEIEFYPTTGNEFYVTLGRNGQGIDKSRMEILSEIESEIINGFDVPSQPLSSPTENNTMVKRLKKWYTGWRFGNAS